MNKFKIGFITLLILLSAIFGVTKVLAAAAFQGGNIFIVGNTSNPGWGDPVNAQIGDIVEFKVDIRNLGPDTNVANVRVRADLPTQESGNTIAATIHVTADNAPEITDTATVNVTNADPAGTRNLTYFPGHATLIAHPGNVTSSIEAIGGGGWVSVGDLSSENNSFIEVLFKAQIVQAVPLASPAPTPAPTPSPTPAPPAATPSPTPSPAAGGVNQSCPTGQTIIGINQQGQIICQNINVSSSSSSSATGGSSNVTITNPAPSAPAAPAVAGAKVTQLPKTGLPGFLALGLAGLLPLGIKLRRTFSVKEELANHPKYLFEQREFKKSN